MLSTTPIRLFAEWELRLLAIAALGLMLIPFLNPLWVLGAAGLYYLLSPNWNWKWKPLSRMSIEEFTALLESVSLGLGPAEATERLRGWGFARFREARKRHSITRRIGSRRRGR